MKNIGEWIKVLIAFVVMVGFGIAPTAAAWYFIIHEALKRPELTLPYVVAGVLSLPATVLIGLMISSPIGGLFIRYWGPK